MPHRPSFIRAGRREPLRRREGNPQRGDAAQLPHDESTGVSVPADDRLFFFEYDPPEHTALRRLLVDLLSRQRSELRAPAMRAVVEDLPAPLVSAVRVDLVQEFSVPLAGRIMMQVAGFPDEDAGQ